MTINNLKSIPAYEWDFLSNDLKEVAEEIEIIKSGNFKQANLTTLKNMLERLNGFKDKLTGEIAIQKFNLSK